MLSEIAGNVWWSWSPEALDLFERLDPAAFARSRNNPLATLADPDPEVLAQASFRERVERVYSEFRTDLAAPLDPGSPRVAYFCMEYALHESLPLYSGGLGVLAGDHLKSASDLGIPLVAVGLFLRDGYFTQYFDEVGRQQDRSDALETGSSPLVRTVGPDGELARVRVHLGDTEVTVGSWTVQVGRTTLHLLDLDEEGTPAELRDLTHRLYQGGMEARIRKEIVLGIGGVRLLRALGLSPDVYHMNEGHCAFLTLELLREELEAGLDRDDAVAKVRSRTVFTTHTPVPAGHDRFDYELFEASFGSMARSLGIPVPELMDLGRIHPGDPGEPFNMTVLGMRMARSSNGVSQLHGAVSRHMWHDLWPGRPVEEVPVGHVTNGVHLATWTSRAASEFLTTHLGDWKANQMEADFWARARNLPDELLWACRRSLREAFLDFAHRRAGEQTLRQTPRLDPDTLTIGFARRFATYKRAPLLFRDLPAAIELISDDTRPLQLVFAGKAHPDDEGGKDLIQELHEVTRHPDVNGRVVFLEDYDMAIGRAMVAGCDVWLNNPRRPMEASGTSGQKVAVHGGLNLAIADGWWPEGYNGSNGWMIGEDESSAHLSEEEQDDRDARLLLETLRAEVIPTFYEQDEWGIPVRWVARMKEAMATLPHAFSSHRMVRDYRDTIYLRHGA
ncbi:MAG: alpha-glucan family phosphorylase [Gemmatimonadales bacterium]|nr:MAG: alpha-glucan family phosphorylase [Gemmatimonadales bacterium]